MYKIKTRDDGTVERYKACLVVCDFTQEYGIDYEETFASVARLTSICTLIVVVTVRGWGLFQMDVKNTFLNVDLQEKVYMTPPLAILMLLRRSVVYAVLCMDLSNPSEPGLLNLVPLFLNLGSLPAIMIQHSFSRSLLRALFLFYYTLIT